MLVAKDENSGKDYGVVRETDGSYRFFDDKKDKPVDDIGRIQKYYSDFIKSDKYAEINNTPTKQQHLQNLKTKYPQYYQDSYPNEFEKTSAEMMRRQIEGEST